MDSVPPATITSAPPPAMRSAAIAIDCNPDEQKRLIVIADASTGNPARSDAIRATFMPCSASGIAQPRITSSISLGSSCGTLSSAPLIAMAPSSSGRVARSVPLNARPTGVRIEETITASRICPFAPVLPDQFLHPGKLRRIGRYQCQLAIDCLPSEENIVAADWLPSLFERGMYGSCSPGIIFVKREQSYRSFEKRF